MPACSVCKHPKKRAIEKAAKADPSVDALVGLCQRFNGVTRAGIERHLAKCPTVAKSSPRRGEVVPDEASPDSGPREAVEAQGKPPTALNGDSDEARPLPAIRELQTAQQELRYQAQLLTRQLEREDLSPTQLAQVSNALRALHRQMAMLRDNSPIHEHAEFPALLEDIITAVVDELGPDAPEGLEGRVADRYEQLQAARLAEASAPRRRAA